MLPKMRRSFQMIWPKSYSVLLQDNFKNVTYKLLCVRIKKAFKYVTFKFLNARARNFQIYVCGLKVTKC